ncbi:MAG: hypothetical protein HYZ75_01005, partial [Elusimicrobia bacterium]|nr:hypothetical protein [Elusimicrobiota bacterium]
RRSTGGTFTLLGSALDTGLTPAATYFYMVRAVNGDGVASADSAVLQVVTDKGTPSTPQAPTPSSVQTTSLFWSWAAVAGADAYGVHAVDGGGAPTFLSSTAAAAYLQTGLAPNTLVRLAVTAINSSGAGSLGPVGSTYTTAAVPSAPTAAVFLSSALVSWTANGNPAATIFEVERASDVVTFSRVHRSAALQFLDSPLAACLTYIYRAKAVNGAGIPTAPSDVLTLTTPARAPAAPSNLRAQALSGNRISLAWDHSPSDGVTEYRLYWDQGTGTLDYVTPLAVLPATVTAHVTGVLVSSPAYRFALRAGNRCGLLEENANVQTTAPSLSSLTGVSAAISSPASGKRVAGNRVTLVARITRGNGAVVSATGNIDEDETRQVAFQYRSAGSAAWLPIPPASALHANPDTSAPFFIHWDVNGVAPGDYEVRAVATNFLGEEDPSPSASSLTVDPVSFESQEVSLGGGTVEKQQQLKSALSNKVESADARSAQVVEVVIPSGALDSDTVTLAVTNNPIGTPSASTAIVSANAFVEVTLADGQTLLANGREAAITISYADANDDGLVDGTSIRATDLAMYTYDEAQQAWMKDITSAVDTDKKTVTGLTPHFSFFGIFAAPAVPAHAVLSSIRIYPNPFKPNGGNPDEGRSFSPADPLSGIIFDQLPTEATITIYTITGQQVARIHAITTTGKVQWDARNDAGRDVASGGYIAVIESPGQHTQIRTVAIIR